MTNLLFRADHFRRIPCSKRFLPCPKESNDRLLRQFSRPENVLNFANHKLRHLFRDFKFGRFLDDRFAHLFIVRVSSCCSHSTVCITESTPDPNCSVFCQDCWVRIAGTAEDRVWYSRYSDIPLKAAAISAPYFCGRKASSSSAVSRPRAPSSLHPNV